MRTIGIIGAGRIAKVFARQLLKSGFRVIISNSRGPSLLASLVTNLGSEAKAGTTHQAAQAEIVILAVHWCQVVQALTNLPSWNGRILIDATNPGIYFSSDLKVADLGVLTSSEFIARLVPGARLVKAFNTLATKLLKIILSKHMEGILFLSPEMMCIPRGFVLIS